MTKHEPKFYVRLCKGKSVIFPNNFIIFPGSIYGRFSDVKGRKFLWVCDSYTLENGKLPVHIFNGNQWKLCMVPAQHPCYKWVKSVIESLGYVPKINREIITIDDCENMMKTYSLHKKGTGSRINTHQINNPLQWKEVTEDAHWYGKGNASVVASNIRR
jgi:hypothetical protein